MKKMVYAAILGLSSHVFADSACNYLNISFQNYSDKPCKLKSSQILSGYLVSGQIPKVLFKDEISPSFKMQQGVTSGPAVQLIYSCNNRTISFHTSQGFCFLSAGEVAGRLETVHFIHAKYRANNGSYWSAQPGSIMWTIF